MASRSTGAEVWLVGRANPEGMPIVAHGRSDEHGRFALALAAGPELAGEGDYRPVTLWAVRTGMRAAVLRFPGRLPDPGRPIRLELGPPAQAEVHVVDPDDAPVVGASIRIDRIAPNNLGIPDPIADRLEATTDAAGRAVLDGFASAELVAIAVRAKGFGSQPRTYYPPTRGPKTVRLSPVAKVSGRLAGGEPAILRGWKVSAWTMSSDGPTGRPRARIGGAEATSDDEGRFEIPAIAAGNLTITVRPPDGVPYLAENLSAGLRAGQDNPITVVVRHAVRLEGQFRDRQSGAPVPGVQLGAIFRRNGRVDTTITDDQGRFSQLVLPGDVSISTSKVPRPYVNTPATGWRTVNVPKEVDRFAVEPIELIRAAPALRGVALDESGKPAAGASVRGAWQMTEEGRGGVYASGATADADGRFALEDIAPDVDVKVSAQSGDLATTEPVAARAGQKEDLTLRLVRSNTGAVRGRVVGPDGRPIAGAVVTVQYWRQNGPSSHSGGFVTFKGANEIRTTDDGTFRTPRELLRADQYAVEARSDGFIAGRTDWIRLEPGDVTLMPDIALMKATTLRAVAGRVVDRRGAPIAAADVLQSGDGPSPTRARTDAQGHFQLRGVVDAAAFVFAEKSGHRFAGRMTGAGGEPVELVLDRSDERPRALRKAAAWPVPWAEERTIARKLLEPAIEAAQEPDLRASGGNKRLAAMARVDPGRVLEMLEERVVAPGQGGQSLLDQVAVGLLEDSPREALDAIASDRDPASRVGAYLALFKAAAPQERDLRRDLLERALAESRRVESPVIRAALLAQMGDSWRELGELDRAAPILRNARALFARSDPQGLGYVQYLAPALAAVDLPAALAVAEGPGPGRVRQYPDAVKMDLGEIAGRIAASHPGRGRAADRPHE